VFRTRVALFGFIMTARLGRTRVPVTVMTSGAPRGVYLSSVGLHRLVVDACGVGAVTVLPAA
jgi:hypothetical protein